MDKLMTTVQVAALMNTDYKNVCNFLAQMVEKYGFPKPQIGISENANRAKYRGYPEAEVRAWLACNNAKDILRELSRESVRGMIAKHNGVNKRIWLMLDVASHLNMNVKLLTPAIPTLQEHWGFPVTYHHKTTLACGLIRDEYLAWYESIDPEVIQRLKDRTLVQYTTKKLSENDTAIRAQFRSIFANGYWSHLPRSRLAKPALAEIQSS